MILCQISLDFRRLGYLTRRSKCLSIVRNQCCWQSSPTSKSLETQQEQFNSKISYKLQTGSSTCEHDFFLIGHWSLCIRDQQSMSLCGKTVDLLILFWVANLQLGMKHIAGILQITQTLSAALVTCSPRNI